ncbi:MAG: beta-galactosidase [Ruminococcaceae bacterium]|nr:beta-galactosidase [Oscillospiraceae bacterium]
MGILTIENGQFHMDGKPYRILSGAMHYFRICPEYWEDRMEKLRQCGFNTLETYCCWNLHERKEGIFDFSGRLDLVKYIRTAQKLGLNVILRPGPYICAEWDLGGLPSRLLRDSIPLRCNDARFLNQLRPYLLKVFELVKPLLATRGGPIIAMQVENEYGSYGNDHDYMAAVNAIYDEGGIDCLRFTADGSCDWTLSGGTLPGLPAAVNFGSGAVENFKSLRDFRRDDPLFCGEFWCGWFDHWYGPHHTRTVEDITAATKELVDTGASLNFYMFHGGTNFGFLNGANHTQGQYQPTITSYDYCALLTESGDLTPAYHAVRVLLGATGELTVSDAPKAAYGAVALTEQASLLPQADALTSPIRSAQTQTQEELGQDFGYTLYRTTLRGPITDLSLELGRVHDRCLVFLDGKQLGIVERSRRKDEMRLSLKAGETAKLEILLENMGRVNYGTKLFDKKGLLDGVRLGQQFHFGWEMLCLPMEDLTGLRWSASAEGPRFLRGKLTIGDTPRDTFLKLHGFTKGFVLLNGFNLGRFYNPAGPQKTLYVPAPLLRQGDNEIIVFESDGFHSTTVEFVDEPDLG